MSSELKLVHHKQAGFTGIVKLEPGKWAFFMEGEDQKLLGWMVFSKKTFLEFIEDMQGLMEEVPADETLN